MEQSKLDTNTFRHLTAPLFPVLYTYSGNFEPLADCLGDYSANYITIDCKRMSCAEDMLLPIAEALQFPDYFGNNGPAFWDMMTDLSWLNQENRILILKNANHMSAIDNNEVGVLLEYLRDISVFWAIPTDNDERYQDHDSLSFKFILQDSSIDDSLYEMVQASAGFYYCQHI